MGTQQNSGLIGSISTTGQSVFNWSSEVHEDPDGNDDSVTVSVNFGLDGNPSFPASVTIPPGQTSAPINAVFQNGEIAVIGTLYVYYSTNKHSYIVTFNGEMSRPNMVNIAGNVIVTAYVD